MLFAGISNLVGLSSVFILLVRPQDHSLQSSLSNWKRSVAESLKNQSQACFVHPAPSATSFFQSHICIPYYKESSRQMLCLGILPCHRLSLFFLDP
ncbi:unnamed protein product [Citrullus colocynthis]|uniref:Uncharacterized protein n=1 Tax=Citrullus colocynthis TaxID=252529 RepID=A0ABP0XPT1_9ROSI